MTKNKAIEKIKDLRIKIKMRHMCKSMDGECTKEDVQEYKDEFEALLMAEKALKDAPDINVGTKWIPCSERLPEESNYYMACIYDCETGEFDFRKTWFAHVDDYSIEESEWRMLYDNETVTAWMPLPEPYKESED